MSDWIICGWYTDDYKPWAERLAAKLNASGHSNHDFVRVEKVPGGWERNTLRKPYEVLAAMDRHPDKTVLFLDVDCEVTGSAEDLARLVDIYGDVGVYARIKTRRAPLFSVRSGTLVMRPTSGARRFVRNWCDASADAALHSTDQDTFVAALVRTSNLTVTFLDVSACCTRRDKNVTPIVLHDSASKDTPKVSKLKRIVADAFQFRGGLKL